MATSAPHGPWMRLADGMRGLGGSRAWRAMTLAVVVGLLWTAATVLARAAHDQRLYRAGEAARRAATATGAGQHAAAVSHLREAVALDPQQPGYRLNLARALVALGKPAEAEPYVLDTLRQQPVDGLANLVHARILDQQGHVEEAERAYYRAIYGRWPSGDYELRRQARLELVETYRRRGDTARLRAALIELSSAFPGDRALQLQAGRDLLDAGFAEDAARQLQVVVDRFSDPGDALRLLAQAEFARHRYVDAYAAAGKALAHDRADTAAAALRTLTARVLSLDPDQPRLSERERARRLGTLLAAASRRLSACVAARGSSADSPLRPLVERWLARRDRDAAIGRTLTEGLARHLTTACPSPSPDDAVGVLLADLSRGQAG